MKTMPQPSFLAALVLAATVPAVQAQSSGKESILQPGPLPAAAAAAADEWRFTFTPYLWLPSVDLDVSMPDVTIGGRTFGGDFSIEQPWWDTLSDFKYWDCDLEASLGWKLNDGVLLSLGYRARGEWEDSSSSDTTVEGWFFGPEVGLTWKF